MKNKQKAQSFLIRARAKLSSPFLILAGVIFVFCAHAEESRKVQQIVDEKLGQLKLDSNDETFDAAAKELRRWGVPAIEALVIRTETHAHRDRAMRLIVRMGATALEQLVVLAAGEHKVAAARLLAAIVDENAPQLIPELMKLMSDPAIQNYAGTAMVKAASPAAKKHLNLFVEGLDSTDAAKRVFCAAALGQLGPKAKSAVEKLAKAAQDEQESVRLAAVVALGKIGPKAQEALAAIETALQDKNAEVRSEAKQALKKIKGS